MKQINYLSCYLLCLLLFSSSKLFEYGLDVYETGHIHDNGSGQFEIAADLTKLEPLIKVASLFANITPEVAQQSVQGAFSTVSKSLKHISGISNVATAHDAKMLHFKLSFQFNSIEALNRAVHALYAHADHPGCTHFTMDNRSFVRVDTQSIAQLIEYYHAQTDLHIANLSPKNFLEATTYNIAYSFDRQIRETANPLFSISKDRKTISLQQPLSDASGKELSFSNKIIF